MALVVEVSARRVSAAPYGACGGVGAVAQGLRYRLTPAYILATPSGALSHFVHPPLGGLGGTEGGSLAGN